MMTRGGLTKAVETFVASSLEPGETVEATLSEAYSGSSFWLAYVRTMLPLGGRTIGYALVLTDRRVLLVRRGTFTNVKPKVVDAAYPRSGVRVGAFTAGPFSGSLRLDIAGTTSLAINFRRAWRGDAARIAEALPRGDIRAT